MSLKEFYHYFRWWMDPGDPRAIERFHSIVRFFESQNLTVDTVLDVCSGTGIAGVAAAKAFSASRVTLVDERGEDMRKVSEWMAIAGVTSAIMMVEGDALNLPHLVGSHDVAVLWGHTMPHFDPFEAVSLFSGVATVLREGGLFFIEETDRIKRFLYGTAYKDFLVEGGLDEKKLVSLHEGYNLRRGTEKRGYYRLPGFEKVADMELRPWDLASQLALGGIFFRKVELITPEEHGLPGVSSVIIFRGPKGKIAREVYSEFQNSLQVYIK